MDDKPTAEDMAFDLTAELELLVRTFGPNGIFAGAMRRALFAESEVKRLQAFKTWVHGYLDAQGVPQHPPGVHGADGCRIGDRMDWLMDLVRGRRAELDAKEMEQKGRGE